MATIGSRLTHGFNEAAGYYRRNRPTTRRYRRCTLAAGFNEAAGYYRRNPAPIACRTGRGGGRFNEAAGYYRRNHTLDVTRRPLCIDASMRPPGITGGIDLVRYGDPRTTRASMRPPGITGGIRRPRAEACDAMRGASMRPPGITGGITR